MTQGDLQRLKAQLMFTRTKIAALIFVVARLKRWRFGQSSESLDPQMSLFEAIAADTAIEEQARASTRIRPRTAHRLAVPCARRCPRRCRASSTATRLRTRTARASSRCCASARTRPSRSTACRRSGQKAPPTRTDACPAAFALASNRGSQAQTCR